MFAKQRCRLTRHNGSPDMPNAYASRGIATKALLKAGSPEEIAKLKSKGAFADFIP